MNVILVLIYDFKHSNDPANSAEVCSLDNPTQTEVEMIAELSGCLEWYLTLDHAPHIETKYVDDIYRILSEE